MSTSSSNSEDVNEVNAPEDDGGLSMLGSPTPSIDQPLLLGFCLTLKIS